MQASRPLTPGRSRATVTPRARLRMLRFLRYAAPVLGGGLLWAGLVGRDLPAEQVRSALWLWLIAAALALRLGREAGGRPSPLPSHWPVLAPPLWGASILGATGLALGWTEVLRAALPALALWGALAALALIGQGRLPPRRLGLLSTPGVPPPPPHPQLEYLPLAPHEPDVLRGLDGLVVGHRGGQVPAEHARLLHHARVIGMPLYSREMLAEVLTGRVSLDLVERDWLDTERFQSGYLPLKRGLDVALTLLLLPVLLPLMGAVALVVLVGDGRPVLFWQERIGLGGRPFRLVKFRTMTRDSERRGAAFAQRGDARILPGGAFLRKFRLDELPQFYNVLRGEMSIIGPRPEQFAFAADLEESIPLYATRHWVRPGITGWAQVTQGYTGSMDELHEKLQYDFYYVKHLSPQLDLLILWKTILTVLTGFGAR
ncbi:sugar transferase [Deinococcus murrayi]|uniref:sugar transferase n=1 Tax=Deinococcus murrayi TaxID=68910 RepID=UPI001FDED27E|nr:sugar transferase [Deinococcus murrayi]